MIAKILVQIQWDEKNTHFLANFQSKTETELLRLYIREAAEGIVLQMTDGQNPTVTALIEEQTTESNLKEPCQRCNIWNRTRNSPLCVHCQSSLLTQHNHEDHIKR